MSEKQTPAQRNPIKALRKEKGLSQTELAKAIGVEQGVISKWELDRSSPDKKYTIALAKYFDVSADYILGLVSDERTEKADMLRGGQLVIDEIVDNAKITGIPAEFLYQLFSLGLPKPYYKVTYLYRRDEAFRRIADMWRELDNNQRSDVANAFEDILNKPVSSSREVSSE